MSNIRNGNTYYIETTTALEVPGLKVAYVIVTATGANAALNLQDVTTTANKANLRVATSGATQLFDFSECPLFFPNGILPDTVTNCVATIVFTESRS